MQRALKRCPQVNTILIIIKQNKKTAHPTCYSEYWGSYSECSKKKFWALKRCPQVNTFNNNLTGRSLSIPCWRLTGISEISSVKAHFLFNAPLTDFLRYFRATFRETRLSKYAGNQHIPPAIPNTAAATPNVKKNPFFWALKRCTQVNTILIITLTGRPLSIPCWRFTGLSKISSVKAHFLFNAPLTDFLRYFRAKFRETRLSK